MSSGGARRGLPVSRRVMNLAHFATQAARRFPGRQALVWRERSWTWGEFDSRVSANTAEMNTSFDNHLTQFKTQVDERVNTLNASLDNRINTLDEVVSSHLGQFQGAVAAGAEIVNQHAVLFQQIIGANLAHMHKLGRQRQIRQPKSK